MEDHPIANIFPLLGNDELKSLAEDIKANGLREPVVTYEGKILDGRNRYRACKLVCVEPTFRPFSNGSPTAFVISLNLQRRHLTPSQSAAASVEALPWFEQEAEEKRKRTEGRPKLSQIIDSVKEPKIKAADQAATLFNTNRQYVSDAKAIKQKAPEEFEKIRSGEKTISQVNRELRKADIVKKIAVMPTDKFRIIYADPPWSYGDTRNLDGWEATAAEDHYPTMTIAELCAMPVFDIVEKDAVLFLWVTSPLLDECWPVIKAWGFEYRASFVWDKVKHNVGNYNSVRHEFLLICIRGSCTPDVKTLHDSVVSIPRTKHSQKPEEFREYIDGLYPNGKRIELFARKKTKGWEVFGKESDATAR